jgi:cytochrome c
MKVLARTGLLLLTVAAAPVAMAADASVENGEEVFKKCRACHDVGPTAKNKVGPLLNGLFGRKAGTIEGFSYSDANRKAGETGWVWTEEVMMKYLENPRETMPGNRMAFVGLRDEQDRKDIIAYLKTFSK